MPEIHLEDFFRYYSGTVEQKEAVQLLQSSMPESLKRDKSDGSLNIAKSLKHQLQKFRPSASTSLPSSRD